MDLTSPRYSMGIMINFEMMMMIQLVSQTCATDHMYEGPDVLMNQSIHQSVSE